MKKILGFALIVALVLTLCACSTQTGNTTKVQTVTDPATADEVVYTDYEDSLRGVCEYMADLGYIYALPESTGDEMTDPKAMNAELIEADEGYKFTCNYNGDTINVEIYSFGDTQSQQYQKARAEGKITLSADIESGTFEVTFSGNGKYMLVYDDSADRADREAAAKDAFKAFYA